ncbi:MAG: Omp28 family outer membrane lipoprotein [Prevotella sp.]|nr:Omp28 family outer membrane lipoprotein [Prevotella sp.]
MISKKIAAVTTVIGYCLTVIGLASCSDIDEADRLKPVNTINRDTIPEVIDTTAVDFFAPYQRHILIEDFTGQDCVNCPNATDLITQLQEMHGHDCVVAVGIHSGPLGVKPEKNAEGLATDLGDTYYNYWKIEMQPYGVIDRSDGPLGTDIWTAKVNWDLAQEQWPATQCNIFVEATIPANSQQADIHVTLAGMKGIVNGKLQLWITEDNIQAFQKMPDGTTNKAYIHNHVLRDAVNGTWGDDCSVEEGQLWEHDYTFTLNNAWKPEDLNIVAFVYNDAGVVQAISTKLKSE